MVPPEKKQGKFEKKDLTSVFNGLSMINRLQLRAAAALETLTGVVRDDTKKHPWMYPFYVVYMVVLLTPLPFPFASKILEAATLAWVYMGLTAWTRWVKGRLKEAFNKENLVKNHEEHIEADPDVAGRYKLDYKSLALRTAKNTAADAYETTRIAFRSFRKLAYKLSPF